MNYKIVLILSTMAVFCSCINPAVKDEPCACGKIYLPLCASNGVTYDNLCQFNCTAEKLWKNEKIRLEVVKEDVCSAPDEMQILQVNSLLDPQPVN